MGTIVIFASSLSITSAFVLIKAIELKFGRKNILLKLIGKLDTRAEKLVSSLKFRSLQLVQSIRYIILIHSKIIFKNLFDRMREKIINEYKVRESVMMGRKNIINKGSVYF